MSVKLRTVFGVIVAFTLPCVASDRATAQPSEERVSEPLWATMSHPASDHHIKAVVSPKPSIKHLHIAQLAPTTAPVLHTEDHSSEGAVKHAPRVKPPAQPADEFTDAPGEQPDEPRTSEHTDKPEHKSGERHTSSKQFIGVADYYADMFHGKRTASGQVHDKRRFTAAHRTLPFGTHLRITNKRNGKTCVVVVNDRGPFTQNRIIDLSYAAAKEVGLLSGRRDVECAVVEDKENEPVID